MNETLVEFKTFEEIEQVKYTNLYYIKKKILLFYNKKKYKTEIYKNSWLSGTYRKNK